MPKRHDVPRAPEQTTTLAVDNIVEVPHNGAVSGIVSTLAEQSVHAEAGRRFPQHTRQLVSSTLTMRGDLGTAKLFAHTALISNPAEHLQVWQSLLYQESASQADEDSLIAECTIVFLIRDAMDGPTARSDPPSAANDAAVDDQLTDTAIERRQQITQSACDVIGRKGFGNATIREIASNAGLSVPLMYKYIRNKDDILYLITKDALKTARSSLFEQQETESATDSRERLLSAIHKYIDYLIENRRVVRLIFFETRFLQPENRSRIIGMEDDFLAYWRSLLDEGIKQGEFREVDRALTANFIYMVCNLCALRSRQVIDYDAAEMKVAITGFILDGLLSD